MFRFLYRLGILTGVVVGFVHLLILENFSAFRDRLTLA